MSFDLPINQPEGPITPEVNNAFYDLLRSKSQLQDLEAEKAELLGKQDTLSQSMSDNGAAIDRAKTSIAEAELVLEGTVSETDVVGPAVFTSAAHDRITLAVLTKDGAKIFTVSVAPAPGERLPVEPPVAPPTPVVDAPVVEEPAPVDPEVPVE